MYIIIAHFGLWVDMDYDI